MRSEKLNGRKFNMVITDLNMPEMDGIELIKKLRAMPDYKFTPIVMLTTESRRKGRRKASWPVRAGGSSSLFRRKSFWPW